jgi:hypothetical protein
MFEHQNREQQKRLLGDNDMGAGGDIESQMMVKERKGASRGVKFEGFK